MNNVIGLIPMVSSLTQGKFISLGSSRTRRKVVALLVFGYRKVLTFENDEGC